MLGIGTKSKSVKKIEQEIGSLEARKTQLQSLHAQALADEAAAEKNLERFLDKGDLSGGLDGAQSSLHAARQNALDLGAAVERQERLIIGAAERLQQAHDREQRERAARAREKAAGAVEAAAGELQRAVDAVAAAFDRLCGAIPHNAVAIKDTAGPPTYWGWAGRSPDEPLNSVEIARCVLAESLYEKSPEAFEVISRNSDVLIQLPLLARRAGKVARGLQRDDGEFLDAVASARAFISSPLRQSAQAIRDGAVPLDQPGSLALPPPPPPEPTVEMLLLKPVYWRDRDNRVYRGDAWHSVHMPISISKRAIELGVAVKMGTREAAAHIEARRDQIGGQEYNPSPPTDLGAVYASTRRR
jgi:hypothetical protein